MRTRKATVEAAPLLGSREPRPPGAGMQLLGSFLVLAVLALTACSERGGQVARVLPDSVALPAAPSAAQLRPQERGLPAQQTDGEDSATAGALLYQANCAVCHGRQGGGRLGPALSGNQNLQPADYVIARILLGGGGMPPFAPRLTATEIASVATYVRSSWENVFGEVDPPTVAVQWSGLRAGPTPGPLEQAREPGEQGTAGPEQQQGQAGQGGQPQAQGQQEEQTQPVQEQADGQGATGELELAVEPGGSRITVIGPDRYAHFAVLPDSERLTGLEPGTYSVTATKDGFRMAGARLSITAGQTTSIALTLQPQLQAAP